MARAKWTCARSRRDKGSARRRRPKNNRKEREAVEVVSAPEHFSHSALKQLQTCALQYRLQRIDRVKPSHRSPGLVLGSVYHRVLAHALLAVKKAKESREAKEAKEPAGAPEELTREDLLCRFDDVWAREVDEVDAPGPAIRWTDRATPENQRELGRALVAAWHEQGLPIFMQAERILAVEEPFRVELVHSDGRVLKTPLVGVIDVIILRADGTVVVMDHKTARQAYSETYVDLDLQATAYTCGARKLGHGDCTFEFHTMLKRKKPELAVVPAARDQDSFDRLFWVARRAEKVIEAGAFLPAAPTWLCDSCEYGHACVVAHRPVVIQVHEATTAAL